ncbi:hypothetical protein WDU94_002884 [Cyamophila willieti]
MKNWTAESKKNHSERMKNFWKNKFGDGGIYRKQDSKLRKERMDNYVRKMKYAGKTRRYKERSESLKKYFKDIKEEGREGEHKVEEEEKGKEEENKKTTHLRYEVRQGLLREFKKEKEILTRSALLKDNSCENCLHRMRREVSKEILFYKTPWNTLEQDGNDGIHEYKTPWDKEERSFMEIMTRRKRELWPPWRRKLHSKFMKEYWKQQIEENTTRLINQRDLKKKYWARTSYKGGDRRKEFSESMKKYLVGKYKKINRTKDSQTRSRLMKEYWKKKIKEGSTERLKKMSKNLKMFWKRLKENKTENCTNNRKTTKLISVPCPLGDGDARLPGSAST